MRRKRCRICMLDNVGGWCVIAGFQGLDPKGSGKMMMTRTRDYITELLVTDAFSFDCF